MPHGDQPLIFDAHLDLAWNALDWNRDLRLPVAEIRRRGPHLARMLSRAVAPGDRPSNFGGCYLSVVSQINPEEAKFAKEFFRKVESTQGYVSWTDEAFAEDAGYRGSTKFGYVALVSVLTSVIMFAGYVVYTKWLK